MGRQVLLQKLDNRQFKWSEALHHFHESIPDKVWVDELILDETTSQVKGGTFSNEFVGVSKIAVDNLKPDLVIFYDLDPKVGMKRKAGHKDSDRYDVKKVNFHRKVRMSYRQLGKKMGRKWKTVDASKSIDEVHQETLILLKRYNIVT